ncbi:SRPBCC domain-containing protein [Rhodococcus pyridinivorans]|uniref:SRPBCC domain-containing protein n=1 Tax=Rhodococcus pyridinivorans TaxID=103816 RepID=UPI0022406CD7|nr:SRPBCC domain-containing protein [Rhodococcus pyridinivorans]WMM75146.1 SRPBCC domain-containing protein [Rhodococcus pyridinivorans]
MKIEEYDLRTGGSYRYEHSDDSGSYRFAGVFHTVRENEFIVQTFEYLGFPDVVSLETLTFVDLGNVPASWSAIPCTRDRRPATAWRKRVWRPPDRGLRTTRGTACRVRDAVSAVHRRAWPSSAARASSCAPSRATTTSSHSSA